MNIFYLHENPVKAAWMMCDKHVIKMILETAQMLSTAHRILDGADYPSLYKATHKNHPSTIWARETSENYYWLADHFHALNEEYRYRYGKDHLSYTKLYDILRKKPKNIRRAGMTPMPQCMPEQYKVESNSVQAYRNYYQGEKAGFAKWTRREQPEWFNA